MSEPDERAEAHPEDEPRAGTDVGSLGEEAAKLLGALSGWARDSSSDSSSDDAVDGPTSTSAPGSVFEAGLGSGLGETLGGLADQAAATISQLNDHVATGSAECTYCPVCRTVHAVRQTSPEVKAHLAGAASSFLQAMAGLLATVPPRSAPPGAAGVERIDLDDPDDPADDEDDDS